MTTSGGGLDGEHAEWTESHRQYVKKVESMLETFCQCHGLDPAAVFTMVQKLVLPVFWTMNSYQQS